MLCGINHDQDSMPELLIHNRPGLHKVVSVWSYQSLLAPLCRDRMFANNLSKKLRVERETASSMQHSMITLRFVCIDCIIFGDKILNYIMGLLLPFSKAHH